MLVLIGLSCYFPINLQLGAPTPFHPPRYTTETKEAEFVFTMSFFKKLKKDLVEDLSKLGLVDKKDEKPAEPSYSGKQTPQLHDITPE